MAAEQSVSGQNRARIASAVAATVSAFVVFVAGGTLVGVMWWDQKQVAEIEVAPVLQVEPEPETETVAAPVEEVVKPPEVVEVVQVQPTRKRAIEVVPDEPETTPVSTPAPIGGKGTVMVIGDAERIRLVGVGGSFGPGSVPSGDYTVMATFPGEEPSAAGSARIFPDSVIRVICSAEHGRCVQR